MYATQPRQRAYSTMFNGNRICASCVRTIALFGLVVFPVYAIAAPPLEKDKPNGTAHVSTLTIKVVGAEGTSQRPLNNAMVSVTGTTLTTRTDANGKATLANLPLGSLKLRIDKEGWGQRDATITLTASQHSVVVELKRLLTTLTVTVNGVVNGSKLPLDGVNVRVQPRQGAPRNNVTNSAGTAVLEDLPRGNVAVKIIPQEGWETGFRADYLLKDANQTLAIELNKRKPPASDP